MSDWTWEDADGNPLTVVAGSPEDRALHPRRVPDARPYFCALMVALTLLDAVTTLAILRRGGVEANPLMAVFVRAGEWQFVGARVGLGLAATALMYFGYGRNWRKGLAYFSFAVVFSFLIVAWNVAQLAHSA